jgi:hypothetical protein
MGRGRQKAKQQKIARKLKYLTTDTDYGALAKELSVQEPGSGSADPFADVDGAFEHGADDDSEKSRGDDTSDRASSIDDDLDEYAKWAAEAAAKATSGEMPVTQSPSGIKAAPHKRIPMPVPSALRKPKKA